MIPYYILVALPAVFAMLFNRSGDRFSISKRHTIITWAFFGVLLFLLVFRHTSVGTDLGTYLPRFEQISETPITQIFEKFEHFEPGYLILNKLIGYISTNERLFLVIVALITVLPVANLYSKYTENAYLTVTIFTVVSISDMMFSGLRQSIAIAIVAMSYRFIKEKKLLPFVLIILCAFLFHKSALIALLLYPIYHMNVTKLKLLFFIPVIGTVLVFNKQIFEFLLQFLGDYADKYQIEETTGYAMIILLALFAIFAYVAPKDEYMDTETKGLRGISVLAFTMQIFALVSPVAMRMNFYFILFIPLLIPRIINRASEKNIKVYKVVGLAMAVFFSLYYIYRGYTSVDTLSLYPYRALWE